VHGNPLIREFSDKTSPPPVAHRFLTRKRCYFLLGALGLAGLGAWGYVHYFRDDNAAPEVSGGEDPGKIEKLAGGTKALFPENKETSFQFDPISGKPPTLTLFNRNGIQRTMANTFHHHMAEQETDPVKKERWEKAPPGIQASFEGLKLR